MLMKLKELILFVIFSTIFNQILNHINFTKVIQFSKSTGILLLVASFMTAILGYIFLSKFNLNPKIINAFLFVVAGFQVYFIEHSFLLS